MTCKETVFTGGSGAGFGMVRLCRRPATRDGYCTQHHPEAVEARRAAQRRRSQERMRAIADSDERKQSALTQAHKYVVTKRVLRATANALALELKTRTGTVAGECECCGGGNDSGLHYHPDCCAESRKALTVALEHCNDKGGA